MDWWILKQLRAQVLIDLQDFIPQDYFEKEIDTFKFSSAFKNSDHLSRELRWGYLAAKFGLGLFFESTITMTARQVSACEVLMNLGLLAGAEAVKNSTTQLSDFARINNISDGNAGEIAEQLKEQHIPTFIDNIRSALEQYLRYLTPHEAKPFLPLLLETHQYGDSTIDFHPNINFLLKRMESAIQNNDAPCVLHASASIFETIAKNIIDIDSIQNKSLGVFFERYQKNSILPKEITNYILSIYQRRNREPLAAHGSTLQPEITMQEAIIIAELTKAFLRIEFTRTTLGNQHINRGNPRI